MAITKVSQAGGAATAANTPAGNTGAVGGTFTAGNLLVAIVGWSYSGVGASITIDVPSGWTAPLATQNNTVPNTGARAYYMASNPGGAQTWTWNATANGGGTLLEWGFTIVEFSGADPSAPLDLTVIANNNAGTATATVDTLAASGTTIAGDALVQMVFAVKSTSPTWTASASSVPTSGWTVGTAFDGTLGTSPFPHATAMWQVLTGTQASPQGVMTASVTVSYVTYLFTFKTPSAAATIPQQRVLRLRNRPMQWTAFSALASSTVQLTAAISASSAVSATNTEAVALAAALSASVAIAATNTESVALTAPLSASVAVAGTNTESVALTGPITASAAVAGANREATALSSALTASVAIAGTNTEAVALNGALSASAVIAGTLTVTGGTTQISAAITASAAVAGVNTEAVSLGAALSASATVAGNVGSGALVAALTVAATLISRTGRATLLGRRGVGTLLARTPSLLIRTRIAIVRLLSRSGR